jgi:hypothetical protein
MSRIKKQRSISEKKDAEKKYELVERVLSNSKKQKPMKRYIVILDEKTHGEGVKTAKKRKLSFSAYVRELIREKENEKN